MSDDESPTPDLTPVLAVMATLLEVAETMVSTTAGYRKKCEAAGFSPTAAEQMAEEFHRHLIAGVLPKMVG